MKKFCAFSIITFTTPAFAVDGAGLTIVDIFGVLVILFGVALPFLLIGGIAALLVFIVRTLRRNARIASMPAIPEPQLPPSIEQMAFTSQDLALMQQWRVFFNGTSYRFGDSLYGTLPEAIAAAKGCSASTNAA